MINSLRRSLRLLVVLALPTMCVAQSITVTPDHATGVYDVGEHVRWTVHAQGITGDLSYQVLPGQGTATAEGVLKSDADGTVDYTFEAPSTVLLKLTGKTASGQDIRGAGGAVADPKGIKPSAECPDDFDAFWKVKIAELRTIPPRPALTPDDAGQPGVSYARITLDNIAGTHVQGQIARPDKGEKFPAILVPQWAGVYGLQKSWVTHRAAGGWLVLNILAHDLPIDQPEAFYREQSAGPLKNYWMIGNADRDTSYFLRMYLSCVRAIDYLKTRPDWDGRTLVVTGESQGGQQTLVTAGLCDGITAALADVPAGCDMLGPEIGRRGGWPNWYDAARGVDAQQADKIRQASRYYDTVNFASRIRCPVLVGTGLIDEVCPSAGVIAAFNQIKTPKELVIMPLAIHNSGKNAHAVYGKRMWEAWMPALLKGQPLPVTP